MSSTRVILAAALLWLCPELVPGGGRPPVVERTVAGRGATSQAAILAGLVEAVRQTDGVRIDEKSSNSRRFEDVMTDLKEGFSASEISVTQIKTASRGLIDSYDVISQEKSEAEYIVKLRVRVTVFDPKTAIQAGSRKSIAVMPFRSSRVAFRVLDREVAAENLSSRLSQRLVEHLVQSHKFHVRDREYLDEIAREHQLTLSGKMPLTEQLRVGQLLGADFLLLGTIEDAQVSNSVVDAGISGISARQVLRGRASIAWRIINVATGKDHWADTFSHDYTERELSAAIRGSDPGITEQFISLLVDDAGFNIAMPAIDGVYPLMVIDIADRQVILNRGGTGVRVGEQYEVYNQGADLVDPATAENLGHRKILVGRILITSVEPKVSYARLIEGDPSQIRVESVCRLISPKHR